MHRYEHQYYSSFMCGKLDPKQFSRGWINIPEQVKFVQSLEESAKLKSNIYCEIGVKRAGSTLCITQVLNKLNRQSELYCVDIDPKSETYFKQLVPQSGPCKSKFFLGSSFQIADKIPGPLAWLFIDGCHCFDCTKKDIEAYAPKVQSGGILILHDCDYRVQLRPPSMQGHPQRSKVGVYDTMFKVPYLQDNFFLIHMMEGAIDHKRLFWNRMAIWLRK